MRPCTTTLRSFLDGWNSSTSAAIADLYIFTLVTGEVFYFSGFQTPLAAPLANTDTPLYEFVLGPRFARTKTKTEVGPQIDELNVDIYVSGDTEPLGVASGGNISWQNAFFNGLFDGAYCELLRAFINTSPPGPTVVGTITWFYGRIGDVDVGRTKIAVRVKSLLDLLTVQMPRRLFQSACNHVFGEPGYGMCGYDRVNGLNAAGTGGGPGRSDIICQTGSTQNTIITTFVAPWPRSYDNGSIIGLTGLNAGFTRTIGLFATNTVTLLGQIFFLKPFLFPVVPNVDEFRMLPGCDHTLATCTNTFFNQARYGGFPYIPPPETAV